MNSILKISILSSCIALSIQASEKPNPHKANLMPPVSPELKAVILKNMPKAPPVKPVVKVPKVPLSEIKYDSDSDDDNNHWVARIRETGPDSLDDHRSHRNQESVEKPTSTKKISKATSEEGN